MLYVSKTFEKFLPKKFYNHFLKFVFAMNIGNGQHQNLNDIQHVTEMLDDFDKESDTLYTVRHHNSNIHTMRHVHLSLKRQAPLYEYTTFFSENMNKILKSLAHGTVEHPKQLISSIELSRSALFHIQTPSYPLLLLSYVKDLLDEKTKASTATSLLTPAVKCYRRYEPFFSDIIEPTGFLRVGLGLLGNG
ncbi:unnamed protein product [Didymodactylos carnosus]|uniref:Uncharacterized protein n=1 Tax=Didymodactylos carnosus TaxID=1234261 RepID=A0A8S2ET99_9BILA|nr:unnamed protein product [Didymodactylos carnosus]CAF4109863.1 unnamed protein product [Didymodactylos carnosus]